MPTTAAPSSPRPAPRRRQPGRRARPASARTVHTGRWTGLSVQLTAVVAVLVVLGLATALSASFVESLQADGNAFAVFKRQALFVAVGAAGYWIAAMIPPAGWRRLGWVAMALSTVGLVVVLTPLGLAEYGSQRWIPIGPFPFQPSEVTKFAVIWWLADVSARKAALGIDIATDRNHAMLPAVPTFVCLAGLLLLEPDLGTTILVGIAIGLVLLLSGLSWRHVATTAAVGVVCAGIAALAAPYRLARLTGWWNPEADPRGAGYQLLQSLTALGSGGLVGSGPGTGRGKWDVIPNPQTDFIFAVVGEEFGFIGTVTVIAVFGALITVGLRVARTTTDPWSAVVAATTVVFIGIQALVNMMAATGLAPITGVTLPLISVGGSSLVMTLVSLGVVASIARRT